MATKKEIILDGNRFSNLDEFYLEAERQLTKDFRSGRNLDAFNDLLRGGFLVHEYEEPIRLTWKNSKKSRADLSQPVRDGSGETLYELLVEIIRGHEHIEFVEA